jgi:hypothetical protein
MFRGTAYTNVEKYWPLQSAPPIDRLRVRGVCGYVPPPPNETNLTERKAEATTDGGNQLHVCVFHSFSCLATDEKYC